MIPYDSKTGNPGWSRETNRGQVHLEALNEFEEIFLANMVVLDPNIRVFEVPLDHSTSDVNDVFVDKVIFISFVYNLEKPSRRKYLNNVSSVPPNKLSAIERVHSHISKHPPKEIGDEGDLAMEHYLRYWGYTTHPATFFTDKEIDSALQRLPGHKG
jgi:hypothetical protein